MVLCRFFRDFIGWEEIGSLVRGTTGMDLDKAALADLANEITNATRRYNAREGLGPETDTLPPWLLDPENAEGARLTPDELSSMLTEYNAI
jgi:aldehyde:ferredoxin oxidoreductase